MENYAMKTKLGFLTEEGRTRSKNAFRRFCAYAVVMLLIAGAGGYGIRRLLVSGPLPIIQQNFFQQAKEKIWRKSLFKSKEDQNIIEKTTHSQKKQKKKL